MNLLYITFGKEPSIYLQASFSIYSFLAQPQGLQSINIITDSADHYQHLAAQVNIILMTENELHAWKGEHQFFWRIKLKAIEKICQMYPNQPVMYVDCDTYLFGDVDVLQNNLKAGIALMHDNEGYLSARKNKTQRNMWKQIAGRLFGGIAMLPTHNMWNAGLVATPNTQNGNDAALAITICDEMCQAGITRYFIEQYAMALALEKFYGIKEAKSVIVHYWSAKEIWNKCLNDFFMRAYFGQWSESKIIEQVRLFDTSKLPAFQRIKNTNLRLKNLVDKIFPNKDLLFIIKK